MQPPREPDDEAERLDHLRSYGVLDTVRNEAFEALVRVASSVCDMPIAVVSLVDARRQWFLAAVGLDGLTETSREVSFCGHAILERDLMEVEDAGRDERFADNPLVAGDPHFRFYAGYPLVDQAGFALGTLCVLDRQPRTLAPYQKKALRDLTTAIVRLLEERRACHALFAAERVAKGVSANLAVVLDAVAGAVGYWDANLINRFANRDYTARFGRPGVPIVGLSMRELVGEELFALNRPHAEAALRGERVRFEREGPDATGVRLVCIADYVPDVRAGEVRGFVATITDVTELKDALRSAT